MGKKEVKRAFTKEQLKTMLQDAGLSVYRLEQELGVKKGNIQDIFKNRKEVRELPVKYEQPILEIIKKFKAVNIDKEIVVKEVLREQGIEVAESEIPSHLPPELISERKAWIGKLIEAKAAVQAGI